MCGLETCLGRRMILKRIWDMGVLEVVVAWLSDLGTRRSAVTVDGPVLFCED